MSEAQNCGGWHHEPGITEKDARKLLKWYRITRMFIVDLWRLKQRLGTWKITDKVLAEMLQNGMEMEPAIAKVREVANG